MNRAPVGTDRRRAEGFPDNPSLQAGCGFFVLSILLQHKGIIRSLGQGEDSGERRKKSTVQFGCAWVTNGSEAEISLKWRQAIPGPPRQNSYDASRVSHFRSLLFQVITGRVA
jgi:hypothetical protein